MAVAPGDGKPGREGPEGKIPCPCLSWHTRFGFWGSWGSSVAWARLFLLMPSPSLDWDPSVCATPGHGSVGPSVLPCASPAAPALPGHLCVRLFQGRGTNVTKMGSLGGTRSAVGADGAAEPSPCRRKRTSLHAQRFPKIPVPEKQSSWGCWTIPELWQPRRDPVPVGDPSSRDRSQFQGDIPVPRRYPSCRDRSLCPCLPLPFPRLMLHLGNQGCSKTHEGFLQYLIFLSPGCSLCPCEF